MNLLKIAMKDLKEFIVQKKNNFYYTYYKSNCFFLWILIFYFFKYEYSTDYEFI